MASIAIKFGRDTGNTLDQAAEKAKEVQAMTVALAWFVNFIEEGGISKMQKDTQIRIFSIFGCNDLEGLKKKAAECKVDPTGIKKNAIMNQVAEEMADFDRKVERLRSAVNEAKAHRADFERQINGLETRIVNLAGDGGKVESVGDIVSKATAAWEKAITERTQHFVNLINQLCAERRLADEGIDPKSAINSAGGALAAVATANEDIKKVTEAVANVIAEKRDAIAKLVPHRDAWGDVEKEQGADLDALEPTHAILEEFCEKFKDAQPKKKDAA